MISPAYAAGINQLDMNNSGSKQNAYVSPIYSPSACVQSPAYTSQISGSAAKARQ